MSAPTRREDINRLLKRTSPEIRKVLRLAHDQGFQVSYARSGHYKVTTPEHWDEKVTVFAPKTPSDRRSVHRVVQKLRRIGVKVPHK